MKVPIIIILALLLMSSLTVYAADVNGTWQGTMETPFGEMENTVILKFDSLKQKLTGRVKSEMFDEKIKKASLKDDKVTFIIDIGFGIMTYEGLLSENELKFKVIGPDGNPTELICTKKK
jgi:hypothetical protein